MLSNMFLWVFPDSSIGKVSTCNAGDPSLTPGLGRSTGEAIGHSLQYSGLENSMDCIVHGVLKNQTRLSDFHFQTLDSVNLCPNSMLNSALLKPLHAYAHNLSIKGPQFCCFEKDPWLCLWALHSPRSRISSNRQRFWIDSLLMKTYRWLTGRCLASLIIREMLTKTTMRKHLIPVRMTTIKKARDNECQWECGEKGTLQPCW